MKKVLDEYKEIEITTVVYSERDYYKYALLNNLISLDDLEKEIIARFGVKHLKELEMICKNLKNEIKDLYSTIDIEYEFKIKK